MRDESTAVGDFYVDERIPVGTAFLVAPATPGRSAQVVKIAGYAPAPVAAAINRWTMPGEGTREDDA